MEPVKQIMTLCTCHASETDAF